MKLGLESRLERTVRRKAHREASRSKAYLAEYNDRTWWGCRGTIEWIATWLGILIGIPLMFGSLASFLIILPLTLGESTRGQTTAAMPILASPTISLFLCAGLLPFWWNAYYRTREQMLSAAMWPLSDRKLFLEPYGVWSSRLALLLVAAALIWMACLTAFRLKPERWQLILMAIAVVANIGHVAAIAVFVLSSTPRTGRLALGSLVVFAMATTFVVNIPLSPTSQRWLSLVLFALPWGWVQGALYFTAFEPSWWAVAYIVPVLVTAAYGIRWLSEGIRIREVMLVQEWPFPMFTRGIANDALMEWYRQCEYFPYPKDYRWEPELKPSKPESLAVVTTMATQALTQSWTNDGWLEQWVARFMTERERIAATVLCRGRFGWTIGWYASFPIAIVMCAILHWGEAAIQYRLSPMAWGFLVASCSIEFGFGMGIMYRARKQHVTTFNLDALLPIFPIGWRDIASVAWKISWLWVAAYVPPVVALVVFLGSTRGQPPGPLFLGGGMALIAAGVFREIAVLGRFVVSHYSVAKQEQKPVSWLVGFSQLQFALVIIGLAFIGIAPSVWALPLVWMALVIGVWMAIWTFERAYLKWAYNKAELDFMCTPTMTR